MSPQAWRSLFLYGTGAYLVLGSFVALIWWLL